jgi:hypothetical protein
MRWAYLILGFVVGLVAAQTLKHLTTLSATPSSFLSESFEHEGILQSFSSLFVQFICSNQMSTRPIEFEPNDFSSLRDVHSFYIVEVDKIILNSNPRHSSRLLVSDVLLHRQPLQCPSIFSEPFYHGVSMIVKGDSKPFPTMLVIDEHDWVTKRVCAEDNKGWLVNRTNFKPLRPDVFPAMNSS